MTKQQRNKEIDWFFDTFNKELVDLDRTKGTYKHNQRRDKREAYIEAKDTFIRSAFNCPRFKELVADYAEAKKQFHIHQEDEETKEAGAKKISVTKSRLHDYIDVFSEILVSYLF